ncbi:1-deoxy-D-xylulose-5-phosphate synthase [Aquirhabdus sp.]|uniref:1-deoxy-D-xylulose-5-phosphate synthase n=1 Tax=Aquirhabdus sp. TaxID=2824160 RepID=UPI00396CEE6D
MMYTQIPELRPDTPLLDAIDAPEQLNNLDLAELQTLAAELRAYILYAAGQSGGHFGANLGVIELTVALHRILDTPRDRLVWDVGHQAYPHKVLTGRREQLPTIRSKNGLAAFPARDESEFDTFGVGHSSTSISAALGMSLALRYQQQKARVACVIGDGAMTAGMAFEAMNDAVQHQADLLVVLNDNDMSISGSVGGLAHHLSGLWQNGLYVHAHDDGTPEVRQRPNWDFRARKPTSDHFKINTDNLFKAIGFEYFGPVDGHDLPELLRVLNALKDRKGCRLLHVYTTKGKGFTPAEQDQIGYHAIAKLGVHKLGAVSTKYASHKPVKYSDVFGQFLCDQAALDSRLLAITPAMCEGSGMVEFAKRYPDRFFDVAIAEQHALTLAAGMACEGIKPVVAIYSTFLQRGYDQLIHDICLQNLDVTFGIDRAGLVGEDGATHAGTFDYAFMRTLPNLVIMAPKDENECRQMLHTAYQHPGPAAVRYPRGAGVGSKIEETFTALPIGKAEVLATFNAGHPQQIALLAFGSRMMVTLEAAAQLAETGLGITVVNMRFIKPLDTALLKQLAQTHQAFVTVEEHAVMAGAGSAVNEALHQMLIIKPVLNLGLSDRFLAHGEHGEMLKEEGLDAAGISRSVSAFLTKLTAL